MTCPGCGQAFTDLHRCYDPADRVRARQAAADLETTRRKEAAAAAIAAARAEVRRHTTTPEENA